MKKRLLKPMACVLYIHTHIFSLTESLESIIGKGNDMDTDRVMIV